MNRNELKTIAEGFKKARPCAPHEAGSHPVATGAFNGWRGAVKGVADALRLEPKARSIFEAACGLIHSDQG